MKRWIAFLLSLCLLCGLPAMAAGTDLSEKQTITEYTTANIVLGDLDVEVPVRHTRIHTLSAQEIVCDTIEVKVPLPTEENLEANRQFVERIKEANQTPSRSYEWTEPDNVQGMTFTSTIVGTINGTGPTRTYDITSFKIERVINTQAPYRAFSNPTAKAVQVGDPTTPGGGLEANGQQLEYGTIQYSTYYNTPADWVPVQYAGIGIGVFYNIPILYTASLGLPDTTLTIEHRLA